jgi:protein-tyrosine phosphatase
LYIGDFASACNKEYLTKMEFTHVVTAILGVDAMFPDTFTYLNLPLRDLRQENIYQVFEKSSEFIKNALKNENGKVYVHCVCGVSRSATLIAAYLIKEYGFSTDQAVEYMQSKRGCVAPNSGFRDQLKRYEAHLRGNKLVRRHSTFF